MLVVKNLSKSYPQTNHWFTKNRSKCVFDHLSFELQAKQNLLICGENGVGKSTLGKILCLIESPSKGEIYFEGRSILGLCAKKQRELRRSIQYVFQNQKNALNPYKTIKQLIYDVFDNFSQQANWKDVDALFNQLGLKPSLLKQKPQSLSGGEAQRIGILRALLVKPKLIIFDESFSQIDRYHSGQILELLKQWQHTKTISYIFIDHERKRFESLPHEILELKSPLGEEV